MRVRVRVCVCACACANVCECVRVSPENGRCHQVKMKAGEEKKKHNNNICTIYEERGRRGGGVVSMLHSRCALDAPFPGSTSKRFLKQDLCVRRVWLRPLIQRYRERQSVGDGVTPVWVLLLGATCYIERDNHLAISVTMFVCLFVCYDSTGTILGGFIFVQFNS